MRYWIVTFDTGDYEITQKRNFDVLGLPSNNRWKGMLNRTSVGDRIIYYARKPLYKFAAILDITSDYYYDESKIWARKDEMWPHRIKTRPLFVVPNNVEMDVKEIIKKMTTPSAKQKTDKHWALFLRGSMREINEYDYNIIISEMQRISGKEMSHLSIADAVDEDISEAKEIVIDSDGERQSTRAREHKEKKFNNKDESIFYHVESVGFEKANKSHEEIVIMIDKLFKAKGYKPFENNHVDLAVDIDNDILLFEVKSATTKRKARAQARRAVGQLFEYEKFDLKKMFGDIKNKKVHRILAMGLLPHKDYVEYLNSLGIATLEVNSNSKINYSNIMNLFKK